MSLKWLLLASNQGTFLSNPPLFNNSVVVIEFFLNSEQDKGKRLNPDLDADPYSDYGRDPCPYKSNTEYFYFIVFTEPTDQKNG